GDAERAVKVFERAAQLGMVEPELARWQGRAQVYSALQRRVGADAVAKEVAKNEPLRPSLAPAPPNNLHDLSVLDELERALPSVRMPSNAPPSRAPHNAPPSRAPGPPRVALPPPPKVASGLPMPVFGNTAPAYARRDELPSEREELLTSDIEQEEIQN